MKQRRSTVAVPTTNSNKIHWRGVHPISGSRRHLRTETEKMAFVRRGCGTNFVA